MDQCDKLEQAAELIKVLAHPTRIRILQLLARRGQLTASAVQHKLQIEQSLLSHHLIMMNTKGALRKHRKGREVHYSLTDPSLMRIVTLLLS